MHNPPRFNISPEIVQEARKCTKGHACLSDPDYELCGIRITTGYHARMICGKGANCPYSSEMGDKFVCTCPVRHAIYRKYSL
jgi:hypothetical protein